MLDAALMMMSPQVADAIERGQTDQRPGNRSPDLAGYATYYCQDDDIMVGAYTPRQHQRLLQALGIDQIIDLPERLTMQWGKAHKDTLTELLEPRFTEQTAEYWEQRLNDFDVPAARVRGICTISLRMSKPIVLGVAAISVRQPTILPLPLLPLDTQRMGRIYRQLVPSKVLTPTKCYPP